MKTFTLRLTDNESAALDRMAACYGMSKNKVLTALIADSYEDLMFFEKQPDQTENTAFLYYFENLEAFPHIMEEHFRDAEKLPISEKKCIKRILAAYDYAIETSDDQNDLKRLEEEKERFLEEVEESL